MARNDPYLPLRKNVDPDNTVVFDGSESSTGTAIVSGLQGNGDAEIRYEVKASDGTYSVVTQFADENGNTTFSGNWNTQFNRIYVDTNTRRLVVKNVSGFQIRVAVDGDER